MTSGDWNRRWKSRLVEFEARTWLRQASSPAKLKMPPTGLACTLRFARAVKVRRLLGPHCCPCCSWLVAIVMYWVYALYIMKWDSVDAVSVSLLLMKHKAWPPWSTVQSQLSVLTLPRLINIHMPQGPSLSLATIKRHFTGNYHNTHTHKIK